MVNIVTLLAGLALLLALASAVWPVPVWVSMLILAVAVLASALPR